jgi:hypothetical protein
MEQAEEAKKREKAFPSGERETLDNRLARMETAINDLMTKGEFLDHHVEHALASIDDHIANMIGKLEKREDKSESRIGDLESVCPALPSSRFVLTLFPLSVFFLSALLHNTAPQIIKKEIDGSLETRLNRLENQLNGNMNRKVKGMESDLNQRLSATLEATKTSAGSWKIPFLIIVVLLGGAAIGLYFFYRNLLKKHLL